MTNSPDPAGSQCSLTVLPAGMALAVTGRWRALAAGAVATALAAEVGRRRKGGRRVFPARASLFSAAWLAERAVCSWLAVGARD